MRTRFLAVVASIAAVAVPLAAPSGAQAGFVTNGGVDVELSVRGPDPADVLAGLTYELFALPGGTDVADSCGAPSSTNSSPLRETVGFSCSGLAIGEYASGLTGVPAGWNVFEFCNPAVDPQVERIDPDGPSFEVDLPVPLWSCSIEVSTPIVGIDKIVSGGDGVVADFELEVYDDGGSKVTDGVDPDAALCSDQLTECLLVPLPAGEYQLGEVLPDHGYEVGAVVCDSNINIERYFGNDAERIDDESAVFFTDDGDAYCTITNEYREGRLQVSVVVVNDEGGAATPADVSIEVFRSDGSEEIAATECAAGGSCLDVMLPIGDYAIGYVGPAGYTRELTQTVLDPPPPQPDERITDDPAAEFTMLDGRQVQIVVTIDDPTAPTTTTTLPPTTTLAPTTTAVGAGGTLPATGTSAQTWLATMASLLVGAGAAMVATRRRPA